MKLYYIPKSETDKQNILEKLTDCLRVNILYMIQQAGAGHIGSAFSAVDIMTELYFKEMQEGDIFFSSKGHDVAALYAILIAKGIIPEEELHNYRRPGGLEGHPNINTPGIVTNTGSLGMGLSKAQGMVLARRLQGKKGRIFVLIGDGEIQEGQISEALRNIFNNGVRDSIYCIMDANQFQLSRTTHICKEAYDILNIKFCHTIKGKGTSVTEGNKYHAGAMDEEDYKQAIKELKGRLPGVNFIETDQRTRPFIEKANSLIPYYSECLRDIMRENDKVVVLDADLAKDCGLEEIRNIYPERFFEFGISEQDMVSAAGGMALEGLIPIVHSFSAFLCRRANEQIYNNCTEKKKTVYVGAFSGILPYGIGLSHTCMDDIVLMKTMPGMTILEPKQDELNVALRWAVYQAPGPTYIRIPCWPILEGMRR